MFNSLDHKTTNYGRDPRFTVKGLSVTFKEYNRLFYKEDEKP